MFAANGYDTTIVTCGGLRAYACNTFFFYYYKMKKHAAYHPRLVHLFPPPNTRNSAIDRQRVRYKEYLQNYLCSDDIVINDYRYIDPVVADIGAARRIYQLHSSHLLNPGNEAPGMKKIYRRLFDASFQQGDRIVVATHSQKSDIELLYPQLADILVVIPHPITIPAKRYMHSPHKIAMICRLVKEKNIPDAIDAFSIVREKYPEIQIDIYGVGPLKDSIKKKINALRLHGSVSLKGYCWNVNKVFQKSSFSILTSTHEGYALVLLESLANGCPFVSYDIKYGASEIGDESSARIVKNCDAASMANAMIDEIEMPKDRMKAVERAKQFSSESYQKSWASLLDPQD
jgi:poly(glycerol-phosphate) alpha-glucosyltransferase